MSASRTVTRIADQDDAVAGKVPLTLGGTGAGDAPTARTNLGLGTAATHPDTDFLTPAGSGSGLTGITESQVVGLTGDLAAKAPLAHAHSASDITSGTLAVARGGTGLGTIASGKLLYASALDTLALLTLGTGLSITSGTLNAAGGGGLTVGSPITSGTNNRFLYQNASGNLAESVNIQYDGSGFTFTCTAGYAFTVVGSSTIYGNYSNNTYATLDVDNYSFSATNSYALSLLGAPSTPTPLARLRGMSSTTTKRDLGYLDAGFSVATDASYKGFVRLMAQDFNATAGGREGVRVGTDGTQALVGFFGHTPVGKAATPTTLADVIAILQNLGLSS